VAREIRWSPRAAADLEQICNYISRDSTHYASLFARRVLAIVTQIARFPRLGRVVPEYGHENLREVIYQSYRIVYRLREEAVEVVAISHGARPLKDTM